MRPANLAQQTPPPGQAARETRANRRPRTGQPPPPRPSPDPQVSPGLGGGVEGGGSRGGGERGARACKWAASRPQQHSSGRRAGERACVCLCFAPTRSRASRGGAAQVTGVLSSSPHLQGPGLSPPPRTPLPNEWPETKAGAGNSRLFLSTRRPAGRAWGVWAPTGQGHFQQERKGRPRRSDHLKDLRCLFLGTWGPPPPSRSETGGRKQVGT